MGLNLERISNFVTSEMEKRGKVSVKHYLNKRLKAKVDAEGNACYPVYVELIYASKPYQFRSAAFDTPVPEDEFEGYRDDPESSALLFLYDKKLVMEAFQRNLDSEFNFDFKKFSVLYSIYSKQIVLELSDFVYRLRKNKLRKRATIFGDDTMAFVPKSKQLKNWTKETLLAQKGPAAGIANNATYSSDAVVLAGEALQSLTTFVLTMLDQKKTQFLVTWFSWIEGDSNELLAKFLRDKGESSLVIEDQINLIDAFVSSYYSILQNQLG